MLNASRAMAMVARALAVFVFLSLLATQGPNAKEAGLPQAMRNCEPVANSRPICGFHNPEDLAALPENQAIIVSEYGGMRGEEPGKLVALFPGDHRREVLFNGGEGLTENRRWGSPDCIVPPGKAFSPHGIDLVQRADGKLQLSVVQHGGRESIEFFEVSGSGVQWKLTWRGCVNAPDDATLNSIAADTKGAFYTTKMFPRSAAFEDLDKYPDQPTGAVYRWTAAEGYKLVKGTEGVVPNGVVTTADGGIIYVVYTGEQELRKVDTRTGKIIGTAPVGSSDNIKWSVGGESLTVATFLPTDLSMKESFALCEESLEMGFCPAPFAIVEVNPENLERQVLFRNDADTPMGAGTVGLKMNEQLFIGSFTGNRILSVDL